MLQFYDPDAGFGSSDFTTQNAQGRLITGVFGDYALGTCNSLFDGIWSLGFTFSEVRLRGGRGVISASTARADACAPLVAPSSSSSSSDKPVNLDHIGNFKFPSIVAQELATSPLSLYAETAQNGGSCGSSGSAYSFEQGGPGGCAGRWCSALHALMHNARPPRLLTGGGCLLMVGGSTTLVTERTSMACFQSEQQNMIEFALNGGYTTGATGTIGWNSAEGPVAMASVSTSVNVGFAAGTMHTWTTSTQTCDSHTESTQTTTSCSISG